MIRTIHPTQAKVDSVGQVFKHLVITLECTQTIAEVFETPECWKMVQGVRDKQLRRGDAVTIISPDGLTLADRATVVRAQAGEVWFGKPLRLVSFDEVALYENDAHRVVPVGTGYSIETKRDGRVDDRIFPNVEGARLEIISRQPKVA